MPQRTVRMMQIMSKAVKRAQAENRAAGIANAYCINGKLVWQLPDGTITNTEPAA